MVARLDIFMIYLSHGIYLNFIRLFWKYSYAVDIADAQSFCQPSVSWEEKKRDGRPPF